MKILKPEEKIQQTIDELRGMASVTFNQKNKNQLIEAADLIKEQQAIINTCKQYNGDAESEIAQLICFAGENMIGIGQDGSELVSGIIDKINTLEATIKALTEKEQSEQSLKLMQEVIKENKEFEEITSQIFDIIFDYTGAESLCVADIPDKIKEMLDDSNNNDGVVSSNDPEKCNCEAVCTCENTSEKGTE